MKTALTYGAALAIGGSLLLLGLFFAGLHETPAGLNVAQAIQIPVSLALVVACLGLAMREKRTATPAETDWGYGSAFSAGLAAGTFGAIFSTGLFAVYVTLVNPHFCEITFQVQLAAAAERLPASRLDQVEPTLRKLASPGILIAGQAFGGLISSTLLAAIVALFFRRRP